MNKLIRSVAFQLAGFLILSSPAFGQDSTNIGRPSAIVQVQRDSVGANLVRISVLDPTYPPKILAEQAKQIGVLTGSGSRGVQVTDDPIDPHRPKESRFVRVTFAVDGLVGRHGEWLRIGPVVKGLAGAPAPHELKDLQINFDFEKPHATDLQNYVSPAVEVSRRGVEQTLEYSVHLKTQDPRLIEIPDTAAVVQKPPQTSNSQPDWLILGTVFVVVLAVGALVYCLFLLRPSPRPRSRT